MTEAARPWVTAGLPPGAYDALKDGLPASRLWSLLLEVAQARAAARRPAELVEQWDRDRFVQPAPVDQRSLVEVDRHLLAAASAFESIELSPVAPLGLLIMGPHRQGVVGAARHRSRVRSDQRDGDRVCAPAARDRQRSYPWRRRIGASAAQEVEAARITANFRIFCLASAGLERRNKRL